VEEVSMRTGNLLKLAGLLFLSASTSVFGGDGLNITIDNGTTNNLIVTIYDRNLIPTQKIIVNQLINGNASISVSVSADDSGQGYVSWTARTVDSDMRQCGRHEKSGLNDGDTVEVYADTDCGGN
jgi:hypothetical protein